MSAAPVTLVIGFDPSCFDNTHFPDVTREMLAKWLKDSHSSMEVAGYPNDHAMIFKDEDQAKEIVMKYLEERHYDIVCVGNGVRSDPASFSMFEKLINLVHEHAPKAKICFNTTPIDTFDAVKRWE